MCESRGRQLSIVPFILSAPDDGDAFVVLLDVCRHRLGARPQSVDGKKTIKQTDWQQAAREANRVYRRADYSHEHPKETLYAGT